MKKSFIVGLLMTMGALAQAATTQYDKVVEYTMGENGTTMINTGTGGNDYNLTNGKGGTVNSNHAPVGSSASLSNPYYWGNVGTSLTGTNSFVMNFWLNPNDLTATQTIFRAGSTGGEIRVYLSSSGNLEVNFRNGADVIESTGGNTVSLTQATWNNVAIICDVAADQTKTYSICVNGEVKATTLLTAEQGNNPFNSNNWHLGVDSGGGATMNSSTLMDNFQIYSIDSFLNDEGKIVTPSDIAQSLYTTNGLAGAYTIPEPSTAALGLIGFATLMLRRRRS